MTSVLWRRSCPCSAHAGGGRRLISAAADKATALEAYHRQARNLEAERQANNVRIRAEIRSGELLKELARATPEQRAENANVTLGRLSNDATNDPSPYAEALTTNNISRQAASRFQALAAVLRVVSVSCRSR